MSSEIAHVLARLELFRGWTEAELGHLAGLGRIEHWREGALVLEEGAHGPRMMVLIAGRVEVVRRDDSGVEHAIGMVEQGEALGEMSLLLDLPRTATVRALTNLNVFAMDRAAFLERIAENDPVVLKLGYVLSRSLARRLHTLNERVLQLLAENQELKRTFSERRQELFHLWDYDG
ncbi:MAG: cyclic nucleotide-binding domain-containing protein [Alphaproteobacteria bacterium]|nr:cyclic nucleotide-binding domain-containing protein [Alphaproteobacteria bacterium]MCB9694552.1 cyclic nucleotide-binding domain-containing protein [Alphaproteobacteria bacterium]